MGSIGDITGGNPSSPNLPRLRPEQRLTPAFMNNVINGIDRATIKTGTGYLVTNYPTGQILTIPKQLPISQGYNLQVLPFIQDDKAWFTVTIGTVNRVIPKIGGKYLDQYDKDGIPPKLEITSESGFVILEVTYDANKPFPSEANIKFVSTRPNTSNETTTSTFILATTEFKPKTKTEEASVSSVQVHKRGNLIVNRFKIAASTYYWYWYTI